MPDPGRKVGKGGQRSDPLVLLHGHGSLQWHPKVVLHHGPESAHVDTDGGVSGALLWGCAAVRCVGVEVVGVVTTAVDA